jgi:outer membrane protein OmpA-like peptidoglycan-associated protein
MTMNLLALAQEAMGRDFSQAAGQFLGESPATTQATLGSLLPAVIGTIAKKGATPDGASGLMSLMNSANLDVSALGNIGGLFAGGGAAANGLLKAGASNLVPALFGDKSGALVNALSASSGMKSSSVTNLLAMVVPLILTFLKKFVAEKGLNASSLSSLLASQGPNLEGALDSRVTGALGFASPGAFLGGLAGAGGDAVKRAGAALAGGVSGATSATMSTASAATEATKSGLMRWLPWVIGLAILLFLWNMFSGKPATTPAPAPAATAPAPPPAPAMAAVTLPAKVYFDVGAATIGADGSKTVASVADLIKKDNLKVTITGYTDKSGDTAKNEELAKNRASAVRDALKAAGVAESSVDMKPPMFVEAGAGNSDAEARRVEITKQ